MRAWLVILLGLLSAASADAAPPPDATSNDTLFAHPVSATQLLQTTLAGPAAELSGARVLSGKFVQRRFLYGLKAPLVSSGDFVLARNKGILWRTSAPFPSEVVLSAHGMSLLDGQTETRISAADHPGLQSALKIFFGLVTLDVRQLADTFELYGDNASDRWRVGLRPRDSALAQVFDRAVISGAQSVERIELDTMRDRTELVFSAVETRAELDASDAARFGE